ncbi:hypothetical protein [Deinococcus hopiensis]|uniref:Uncharacterized protein n=1 Tax=Deinococcus hopiensis KR-140 TaxID=695939 RepID=A0A1W1V9V1_9DEIO|nr:hypothetical protein [Deinococcus hopiensis]SMB90237.1 hypothetical protein SAMN00790413_00693 [Deinococcus hopiensis KR-140]
MLATACTDTFPERDHSARAVMLTTADFSTSEGGVALRLLPSISGEGGSPLAPLFIPRGDTLTGNLLCG